MYRTIVLSKLEDCNFNKNWINFAIKSKFTALKYSHKYFKSIFVTFECNFVEVSIYMSLYVQLALRWRILEERLLCSVNILFCLLFHCWELWNLSLIDLGFVCSESNVITSNRGQAFLQIIKTHAALLHLNDMQKFCTLRMDNCTCWILEYEAFGLLIWYKKKHKFTIFTPSTAKNCKSLLIDFWFIIKMYTLYEKRRNYSTRNQTTFWQVSTELYWTGKPEDENWFHSWAVRTKTLCERL